MGLDHAGRLVGSRRVVHEGPLSSVPGRQPAAGSLVQPMLGDLCADDGPRAALAPGGRLISGERRSIGPGAAGPKLGAAGLCAAKAGAAG